MPRDFTAKKYERLCAALVAAGYQSLLFVDYLTVPRVNGKRVMLRHDVDRFAESALRLAEIEHSMGLAATYYFRVPGTLNPDIIREIHAMGHEIGLHYEVLDKAAGNTERAAELLKEDLERLRAVAPVSLAAMHGNPGTPYNNRDIWHQLAMDDYGILGEAYLSVDFSQFVYLSDTGRTWDPKRFNVYDHIPEGTATSMVAKQIRSTNDVIEFVNDSDANLYLLTHPERWPMSLPWWFLSWAMDTAANPLKLLFQSIHRLGSRFSRD